MKHFLQTRRRRVIAAGAASIAGVGLLFTGVASAASSGPTSSAASSGPTSSAASSGPTSSAASSGPTSNSVTSGTALKEIRAQLKTGATHGTVTVTTKKGAKSVEFERGVVQAATSSGFEVSESGGATQTWVDGPKLKVRARGQRKTGTTGTSSATVTDGESVIVVGAQNGSTSTARLVVVLPAAKHGKKSHGTPTPGATT